MTKREMGEIFSVFSIAYPDKKPFSGKPDDILPAVELWCACLPEVDFWTGLQAARRLCRECKFPPTIAEFKEKADAVVGEVTKLIDEAWFLIQTPMRFSGMSPAEAYARLPNGATKAAIDAMGGPDKLLIVRWGETYLDFEGFQRAYKALLRDERAALPGAQPLTLRGRGGK